MSGTLSHIEIEDADMKPPEDKFVGVEFLADRYGTSHRVIQDLLGSGKIPGVLKVGRCWRVNLTHLLTWESNSYVTKKEHYEWPKSIKGNGPLTSKRVSSSVVDNVAYQLACEIERRQKSGPKSRNSGSTANTLMKTIFG